MADSRFRPLGGSVALHIRYEVTIRFDSHNFLQRSIDTDRLSQFQMYKLHTVAAPGFFIWGGQRGGRVTA
jgi:hypothetical protein